MYREHNIWYYISTGLLALLSIPALIGDTAYLVHNFNTVTAWLSQSNIPQILIGYLNTFIHLIEFTFNHFGGVVIALIIWWLICKR